MFRDTDGEMAMTVCSRGLETILSPERIRCLSGMRFGSMIYCEDGYIDQRVNELRIYYWEIFNIGIKRK